MNLEHVTHGPVRLGRRQGALAVASLLVLALAAAPSASQAQGGGQPVSPGAMVMSKAPQPTLTSAVLINASITDDTPNQAHIVLNFNTHAPAFSVIKGDGDHPAVAFVSTTRGNSVRVQPSGKGLLRSINFDQQSSIMVIRLETTATVTMTATPSGDQTVTITVGTDHPTADTTSSSSLPKAEQRPAGEDGFEVVLLKYADISEVVGLLTDGQAVKSNDIFIPTEPAFGSAGVSGNPNTPPPQQNPAALDQSLAQSVDAAIGVDRRLNAIILKGSPEQIARLKQKIAEIDVPVQSVILETMFVELDESGATDVGLNFNNTNGQIGVATFQSGVFAPSGASLSKGVGSLSFQAALYGQVMKGHGRIVSKPRIAAQSGSTAKIITGDALPILTSIALSGVNAVSQQVQYVNVGVTLQIAPRVSSNGFVTSHVFCVVSSVTGTSQGYPTISQREAETSATVRDGETFVIGG
ncbi:MAG TPA: secretin N-terminal domain-containing protein, partial [Caulobacteraceae bacterium]|nr:secretin N-terminal domain-containing protein [Caulobacteraceae bacterium]